MLGKVKLTEKCKIIGIPMDRSSTTVQKDNTPLYLKNMCSLHLFLLELNLFEHYSRTPVFIISTQHFASDLP